MGALSLSVLRTTLHTLPRTLVVPQETDRIHAAVALVLRKRPGVPVELLLIKRAEHPRDPWSGHMALPGGRMEAHDPHLLATAVRETREETGVHLPDAATDEFLGLLPRVAPSSRLIPRVAVTPHLFAAYPDTEARAASPEVERIRWVTLEALAAPDTLDEIRIDIRGEPRRFPGYRFGDDVVWGLTYRILTDFLDRLRSSPGDPPPAL
jgi:8-oxo-dGTP pyrophosphatase MutT (NUDIX family)